MKAESVPLPQYEEFHTRVIFYRIPKNASTSIYNHLGKANIMFSHAEAIEEKADKKLYKDAFDPSHVKPDDFRNLIIGENVKNYFSFRVVRNPWDRALSMYLHAKKNNFQKAYGIRGNVTFDLFCEIFEEHIDDPHFIGTHKQVDWTVGKYPPQKILRFENINEEFSEMVIEHNLVMVNSALPHKNKTDHTHYSDYYSSHTKKIIEKIYEKDIDAFKYTFEGKASEEQSVNTEGFLRI